MYIKARDYNPVTLTFKSRTRVKEYIVMKSSCLRRGLYFLLKGNPYLVVVNG